MLTTLSSRFYLQFDLWNINFYEIDNEFSILLTDQFSKYDKKMISLEKAQDKVRKELAKVFPHLKFGSYTSIEYIFDAMLRPVK